MLLINVLIVLLVPFILGIFLLSLFLQKGAAQFNFWEKLALAFALGLGFLVIMMFLLASIKILLTFANILIAVLIIITLIGLYLFKKRTFCIEINEIKKSFTFKEANFNLIEYILIFLICLKVIYVFFSALIKPLIDIDAFKYYSIVAKGIFFEKTFFTPYLSRFLEDKPPFPFLSQGWAFIGLHNINDSLFKILPPMLFVCFLAIFYSILKRYYSRQYTLLFTFLLSSLPFLVFHVAVAYADFSMTFYHAVATIYLFLFMKEFSRQNKDKAHANLTIALLLLAISVWVKRAGIVLAGIDIFILLIFLSFYRKIILRLDIKRVVIALLIFTILVLPWVAHGKTRTFTRILKSLIATETQGAPSTSLSETTPPNKINIISSIFFRKLFLYADWHLLWFLFLISLFFFYKKSYRKPYIFLLAIILLDILVLFVQFGSKETFKYLLDGTLLDRLIMNEVPIALYFCAEVIIPSITKEKQN